MGHAPYLFVCCIALSEAHLHASSSLARPYGGALAADSGAFSQLQPLKVFVLQPAIRRTVSICRMHHVYDYVCVCKYAKRTYYSLTVRSAYGGGGTAVVV